jgi:phage/plasmid-associated DNA primase
MNQEFYDNFILLLLKTAKDHINDNKIEQPEEVINETANYFDSNNPVKSYIESRLVIDETTINKKMKMVDLYDDYIGNDYEKISKTRFRDDIIHNGIKIEKLRGNMYAMGLSLKTVNDFIEE